MRKIFERIRIYTRTKQFVQTIMLLGILLLATNIIYQQNYIGKRGSIDEKDITTSIKSLINEHYRRCADWISTNYDSLYLEELWKLSYSSANDEESAYFASYEKKVSIFLLDNDSLVYWSNLIYLGEVNDQLLETPPTIFTMDSIQMIIYNFGQKEKKACMLINLYHPVWGFNPYIFENQDISLFPYSEGVTIPDGGVLIDVGGVRFIVQPHVREAAPAFITFMGWLGVLFIMLAIRRYARMRTTRFNALTVSLVVLFVFGVIRIALAYYNTPGFFCKNSGITSNEGGLRLNSTENLIVSFVFILIYLIYLYSVRYKIKWKLSHFSKGGQYLVLIIALFLENMVLIYFHYAGINIVYNTAINIELYNFYLVNFQGILFCISGAFFLSIRVLMDRISFTSFPNLSIAIVAITSVTLMTLMLLPIQKYIYNSGYLLILFNCMFMSLAVFRRKINENTMLTASAAVVAVYIVSFLTIEMAKVRDIKPQEYLDILVKNIEIIENPSVSTEYQKVINELNQSKYHDLTYAVFNDKGVMETKMGNTLDVQTLIPFVAMSKDTVLSYYKYKHYIRHIDDNVSVIVSHGRTSLVNVLTLFVYLFIIIYVISLGLLRLARYIPKSLFGYSRLAFRIRAIVIGVLFMTMTIVIVVLTNFSMDSFQRNKRQKINDNMRMLLRSFNTYAASYKGDTENILLDWYINSGSSFDFTINIYDTQGVIINEPANLVYLKIPRRMSGEAFMQLKLNKRPFFMKQLNTKIENFTHAFTPVYYHENTIGYLSFVYYDYMWQQTDPNFSMLNNILNIFTIILFLSMVVSLVLYRMITNPLKQLHYALRHVGQMQKIPIEKSRKIDDEVSELAVQYNMMIDYLQESYLQLARSEREGAWKEMALQVAHEIKNPLTPMRLKIQMLQHLKAKNDPAFEKMLDSALNTLIEQIDMLSRIATEFSDFAKLSAGIPKRINLGNMLQNVSELYTTYDNITIRFQQESTVPIYVNADYQQLSRVIINLCQNAIQAISNKEGVISIRLRQEDSFARIEVEDNGSGIPLKIRPKIFMPNFTTKNSGSGLGLAISREILRTFGATINFESTLGKGTTFIIMIPMIEE